MYKPTPPEARGVGAYSKIYPGMFFPLIILVSETPIMLKTKFNSSNKWTWKLSRVVYNLHGQTGRSTVWANGT